jgi:hypothetical protein
MWLQSQHGRRAREVCTHASLLWRHEGTFLCDDPLPSFRFVFFRTEQVSCVAGLPVHKLRRQSLVYLLSISLKYTCMNFYGLQLVLFRDAGLLAAYVIFDKPWELNYG